MSCTPGSVSQIDHRSASAKASDAIIVGSGVDSLIIAHEWIQHGFSGLVLEAGPGTALTIRGYETNLSRFNSAPAKSNNTSYPVNRNASMPRSVDTHKLQPRQPDAYNHLVQNGPLALDGTYPGVGGGTSRH